MKHLQWTKMGDDEFCLHDLDYGAIYARVTLKEMVTISTFAQEETGDNGETLMYLLDMHFERKDRQS